jgi:predicted pyridoxine 5'-phosphate oxidase superfamily flavin-nucleotide-binding protein
VVGTRTSGFHAGEIAVQRRAGVRAAADRLVGMLDEPELRSGFARFLDQRTFAALSARDRSGRLWIEALTGPPGFLEVAGRATLQVHASPAPPLDALPTGQPVGLLAVEFARRRRVRLNGTLATAGPEGLSIVVDEAYGNCPQYIQQRLLEPAAVPSDAGVRRSDEMSAADMDLVRRSDTFLLGTTHADRGNDASHRGGRPGFVRVEDAGHLWWPDYPGNNMFNSLGNLAEDPTAALLFVDFGTGAMLHLSGRAETQWAVSGSGDDGGTGRRVRFTVEAVVAGGIMPLRADGVGPSPSNPPLTHPGRDGS